MAFSKILIKNKKTLSYWKITGYNVSVISKRAAFYVCGWENKEDRDNDESHPSCLEPHNIYDSAKFDEIFSTSEMDKLSNNLVKAIYKYAKENIEDFQDATDI